MKFPEVTVDGGVKRQVLAENEKLMVVAFRFQAGMAGSLHSHPHVQSTFVRSGRFDFTVADETFSVGAGDSFVIPSDTKHGCVCVEDGELIDSFAPRRDDFLYLRGPHDSYTNS